MPIVIYLDWKAIGIIISAAKKRMEQHPKLEVKTIDVEILNKKLENFTFGIQTNVYIKLF